MELNVVVGILGIKDRREREKKSGAFDFDIFLRRKKYTVNSQQFLISKGKADIWNKQASIY